MAILEMTVPIASPTAHDNPKLHRAHPRFYWGGTASVCFHPNQPDLTCELVDLSEGGCRVGYVHAIPAAAGEPVMVTLYVRGFELQLTGIIRHIDEGVRAGIQFVNLRGETAIQLRVVMTALNRRNGEKNNHCGLRGPLGHM